MTRIKPISFFLLTFLFSVIGQSCIQKRKSAEFIKDFSQIKEEGEITAVTLYGSSSYFQYKMQPLGFEYDLMEDFANSHNLTLNLKVADDIEELKEMLLSGEADVVAYPIQIDNRNKKEIIYCGHENLTTQVLIQRANRNDTLLTDVTQLIGKEVYVIANTRFSERLKNLNSELGGGIIIRETPKDSLSLEDLIELVSRGEIPYTISDDNTARLNKTYFWNIDISLPVSFMQRSSWVVRNSSPELATAINQWAENSSGLRAYNSTVKRYFEMSKRLLEEAVPEIKDGHISPYDSLFQRHAVTLGWDWQLLAAISYQESHFNPYAVSWAGAEGLMGVMPNTARALGVTPYELTDPDIGVRTGMECLRRFRQGFSSITDPAEKMKFTLGAYNAGIGHIYDAQRLAEKYGKDPSVWDDNVAEYVRLKTDPEYYNDPVCKHGYLRGSETYNYVIEVMDRYRYYKERTK
ncbi:transglycosylase SLT domain-containing protein [Parabacteroides sp. OttesenSCG-928-G07]|nr:transglycosylase SLT domain-containing protein [Parabacteroides sp. OttesenSCG-928-G21]MDL2278153.1 transglycosylase SLT domain-containing protein [Parabacteroides sp. OttesenSCG-928-G07]